MYNPSWLCHANSFFKICFQQWINKWTLYKMSYKTSCKKKHLLWYHSKTLYNVMLPWKKIFKTFRICTKKWRPILCPSCRIQKFSLEPSSPNLRFYCYMALHFRQKRQRLWRPCPYLHQTRILYKRVLPPQAKQVQHLQKIPRMRCSSRVPNGHPQILFEKSFYHQKFKPYWMCSLQTRPGSKDCMPRVFTCGEPNSLSNRRKWSKRCCRS
uniref:PK205R n=1 Tax=African swine fever virus TaxID=10497 RepID=A0A6G7KU41_ASF